MEQPAGGAGGEAKRPESAAPIGVIAFEHSGKPHHMQADTRCVHKNGIKVAENRLASRILMRS